MRLIISSHVLVMLLAASAFAASPDVRGITPVGGQRGTTVEIKIHGERLADAQEILWHDPGFSVADFKADPGNFVTAKLTLAADCELGLHGFRVRTATGVSNLKTFSVGALPEVAEVEPNSEFEKPQAVAINSTIAGVVENEDVDYYQIDVKQGQRINLEIEGLRLGYTFFDPYIAVLDKGRFELARSDDAAIARQDCACSFVAPADGIYLVQVRESSFRGDGNCKYRLHVGTFPRPTAMIPAGGKPGETLSVRWLGDPAGERTEQITLPAIAKRGFGVFAKDEAGVSPLPNPFIVNDLPGIGEAEPNDNDKECSVMTVPGAAHGVIGTEDDQDRFKFTGVKGQVLDINVYARRLGSPLDPVLNVHQVKGGNVGGNDDNAGSPDSYQRVTIPEDGEYVVQVRDHLKQGGPEYFYRIEVAPLKPSLTMVLPELEQYRDTVAAVPRGNRFAMLIGAERAEFGGEVKFDLKELPPGVHVESAVIPGNRQNVPVLLTAAADAPIGGRLVEIAGKCTEPNQPHEGRLLQRTSLVRGDNNRDVWHFDTEKFGVAVTDESPFAIEIVQPNSPIVRGGSKELKVVAKRKDGFTAPIALKWLYAPPGVGVNNSITIAEGQSEALVPLTADGGAEINTWKIALLGEATVNGGQLAVSTQLANLEVAEPYLALTLQAASVEQGQQTDMLVKFEKRRDWDGAAKIELLGLPHEVTSDPKDAAKDSTDLTFAVKTTPKSPAGQHKSLFCRATVTINGEPVFHGFGGGELRIDTPLPPKANEPAPPPPTEVAAAPAPPTEKPLTRLEKLRKERGGK